MTKLVLLSFCLFVINIYRIQCVTPVAHLVKYDNQKKLNYTELEAKVKNLKFIREDDI